MGRRGAGCRGGGLTATFRARSSIGWSTTDQVSNNNHHNDDNNTRIIPENHSPIRHTVLHPCIICRASYRSRNDLFNHTKAKHYPKFFDVLMGCGKPASRVDEWMDALLADCHTFSPLFGAEGGTGGDEGYRALDDISTALQLDTSSASVGKLDPMKSGSATPAPSAETELDRAPIPETRRAPAAAAAVGTVLLKSEKTLAAELPSFSNITPTDAVTQREPFNVRELPPLPVADVTGVRCQEESGQGGVNLRSEFDLVDTSFSGDTSSGAEPEQPMVAASAAQDAITIKQELLPCSFPDQKRYEPGALKRLLGEHGLPETIAIQHPENHLNGPRSDCMEAISAIDLLSADDGAAIEAEHHSNSSYATNFASASATCIINNYNYNSVINSVINNPNHHIITEFDITNMVDLDVILYLRQKHLLPSTMYCSKEACKGREMEFIHRQRKDRNARWQFYCRKCNCCRSMLNGDPGSGDDDIGASCSKKSNNGAWLSESHSAGLDPNPTTSVSDTAATKRDRPASLFISGLCSGSVMICNASPEREPSSTAPDHNGTCNHASIAESNEDLANSNSPSSEEAMQQSPTALGVVRIRRGVGNKLPLHMAEQWWRRTLLTADHHKNGAKVDVFESFLQMLAVTQGVFS